MEQKKIDRINLLAQKEREQGLSEEEKQERQALRREYIESFKAGLKSQLDRLIIIEQDGTKHPLRQKDERSC